MLYSIIGLFALGAVVGMYLLSFVLRSKETPKVAVVIHGLFVAVALVMLIYYNMNNGPGLSETIVIFILAAASGLVLVVRDFSKKSLPKWLAVGHGLIAVVGFLFLLAYTFTK